MVTTKPRKRKARDLPFEELLRQMARAHRRMDTGENSQIKFTMTIEPRPPSKPSEGQS